MFYTINKFTKFENIPLVEVLRRHKIQFDKIISENVNNKYQIFYRKRKKFKVVNQSINYLL